VLAKLDVVRDEAASAQLGVQIVLGLARSPWNSLRHGQ
jgi:hypothetical protein